MEAGQKCPYCKAKTKFTLWGIACEVCGYVAGHKEGYKMRCKK
jgi:hypothetical protein